ncbi:hypothetical protein KBI33_01080 [Candidatus Shapirobacteria bacterium]|nr:hypothetical protein [Candidatus Shapirobacteria bacterium]
MVEDKKNWAIKVGKIVGPQDETHWSQTHVFVPPEKEKREKKGSLLAVFSLASESSFPPDLGKELIFRLQEEYYGQAQGWPMQNLIAAVEKVAAEVEESRLGVELEITAAVFWRGIWYFITNGEGRAYVKRGPTLSAVLSGEGKISSSSGKAEAGDLILLGNNLFFQNLPAERVRQALETFSPALAAETLSPFLAKEGRLGAAALAVKLEEREKESGEKEKSGGEERLNFSGVKAGLSKYGKPVVLVFFVLLLIWAAFWGVGKKKESDLSKQQKILVQAEEKISQAQALAELNPLQAKTILEEQKAVLEKIKGEGELGAKKEELAIRLEQLLTKVNQPEEETPLPKEEWPVFLETQEISDVANLGKTIYILSPESGKIFQIDWEEKTSAVFLGDEKISKMRLIVPQLNKMLLLADDGIHQADKSKLSPIIEKEESWGKIVSMSSWLGNLYLLDSTKDQIWQYPATASGFGAAREWIKEKKRDFSEQARMTIDGAVWIVDQGTVFRYWKGYEEKVFSPEGLGKEVLPYTTADFDLLYLWDKEKGKIISLNKEDGKITGEKNIGKIEGGSNFIVSPDQTMALIGAGKKLVEIELK